MKKYVCKKCGLTYFDSLPEDCLMCYTPKEKFVLVEEGVKELPDFKKIRAFRNEGYGGPFQKTAGI